MYNHCLQLRVSISDRCLGSVCQNGGTCVANGNSENRICDCVAGFTGQHCEAGMVHKAQLHRTRCVQFAEYENHPETQNYVEAMSSCSLIHSLKEFINNITSHDRSFGCPIIYTDTHSQCHYVHRHIKNA